MAEEFVDLYEVLELPIDADRATVRRRINERYLDAQRNIDHRHFATRVKFQELFEVTLPQARYILLDDGRRDEYNRLVNAFRSSSGATPGGHTDAPASVSNSASPSPNSFSLEISPDSIPGSSVPQSAPPIEALPPAPLDPEQLAKERDELWKKWKSGLESALTVEDGDKPKSRGATTSAPTSFSVAAAPDAPPEVASQSAPLHSAPALESPVAAAPISASTPAPAKTPAPKVAAKPKVEISFGSGEESASPSEGGAPLLSGEEPLGERDKQPTSQEIEARRTEHRRQITKEILVNVGLIWGIAGAALVIVPGVAALVAAVGHYYPRVGKQLLNFPPAVLWGAGFLIIGAGAFFASRELSKNMRRKKANQLSLLSYEEVLKLTVKS